MFFGFYLLTGSLFRSGAPGNQNLHVEVIGLRSHHRPPGRVINRRSAISLRNAYICLVPYFREGSSSPLLVAPTLFPSGAKNMAVGMPLSSVTPSDFAIS